jgi:predicted TIM-barrel fold metal-dependent hydrolase
MCGSDWPYSLMNGEFNRVWGLTSRALRDAAPDDSEKLLGGNARELYGVAAPV